MTDREYYTQLWQNLDLSVEANLQFAQLVIKQEQNNTKFFFGDYSYEIIKWIAISIFSFNASEVNNHIYRIYGDYFEFVTNPIDDFNQPQWYQLKSYKGLNGMKLKSWLMKNSHQFFARKKKNEYKIISNERDLIEYVDYESLLGLGDNQKSLSDEDCIYRERLSKAWSCLSEKDKNILHYLILEELNWQDAFDELKEYINPRDGREVIETWSDQTKKHALAMMKFRAIKHLTIRFKHV